MGLNHPFFPNNPVWVYAEFIQSWTAPDGTRYDLGIYGNSAAIAYGPNGGEYLSGPAIPANFENENSPYPVLSRLRPELEVYCNTVDL